MEQQTQEPLPYQAMVGLGSDNYSLSNCQGMFFTGTVLIITINDGIITNNIIITTAIHHSSTIFATRASESSKWRASWKGRSEAPPGEPFFVPEQHLEQQLFAFYTIMFCWICWSSSSSWFLRALLDPMISNYSIKVSLQSTFIVLCIVCSMKNFRFELIIGQSSPGLSDPHSSSSLASSSAQVIINFLLLLFFKAEPEVSWPPLVFSLLLLG